jgi:hypothetical protein
MTHKRTTIRNNIADVLKAIPSIKSFQIGRTVDIEQDELPHCTIEALDDNVESMHLNGATNHTMEISLVVTVRDLTNIYDTLDAIAEDIETALLDDDDLDSNINMIDIQRTTFTLSDEQPLGEMRLVYYVSYLNP